MTGTNPTTEPHVRPGGRRHITGALIFLLIGVFAVFSLLLVLTGVRAYRSVVDASDVNGSVRASIHYVANKIRASDGSVLVERMNGTDVLTIRQDVDGDAYETRVYFLPDEDDPGTGALYEQLIDAGEPFDPELGERISEIKHFAIEQRHDVIRLSVEASNGEVHRMDMRLRAGNAAP